MICTEVSSCLSRLCSYMCLLKSYMYIVVRTCTYVYMYLNMGVVVHTDDNVRVVLIFLPETRAL